MDSGIAFPHPHISAVGVGTALVGERAGTAGAADTMDRIGHGTAVAAAVSEKAPQAELIPVRVFERTLQTNADVLAAAIRWAADHDCALINLSLGTQNAERDALLRDAVAYASKKGSHVIAAYESEGARWLPGALADCDGILRVVGDATIERDALRSEVRDGLACVAASVYARPIPGVPPERNLHGVSFAVANVTGLLARGLSDGRTVTEILGA